MTRPSNIFSGRYPTARAYPRVDLRIVRKMKLKVLPARTFDIPRESCQPDCQRVFFSDEYKEGFSFFPFLVSLEGNLCSLSALEDVLVFVYLFIYLELRRQCQLKRQKSVLYVKSNLNSVDNSISAVILRSLGGVIFSQNFKNSRGALPLHPAGGSAPWTPAGGYPRTPGEDFFHRPAYAPVAARLCVCSAEQNWSRIC